MARIFTSQPRACSVSGWFLLFALALGACGSDRTATSREVDEDGESSGGAAGQSGAEEEAVAGSAGSSAGPEEEAASGGAAGANVGESEPEAPPVLNVLPAEVVEGDVGVAELRFVVELTRPSSGDVAGDYATSNVRAEAGSDYTLTKGTFEIPEGETEAVLVVDVHGDTAWEPDEVVTMSVQNLRGNATLGEEQALGTIVNDDLPELSVIGSEIVEGDAGTRGLRFELELEAPTDGVSVVYTTADDTALAGSDYQAASGTLVFAAGETRGRVEVEVNGDTDFENTERFWLELDELDGDAVLGFASAAGTIIDDDADRAPVVSVSGANALEGDDGSTEIVFYVGVSPTAAGELTLDYATADASALAGSDYEAASGSLVIPAHGTSGEIRVRVLGDTEIEDNETFALELSLDSELATLFVERATGTILDDDAPLGPPRLRVNDGSLLEGDSGVSELSFSITLSYASEHDVSFDYETADVSAIAGNDYEAASGSWVIPAGVTQVELPVAVFGDEVIEADEAFELRLSNVAGDVEVDDLIGRGRIITDDFLLFVTTGDAALVEGNGGSAELVFTLALSEAASEPITLDYATVDETATAGVDYAEASGSVTFAPGQTEATIAVVVHGDTFPENDETFVLVLGEPPLGVELRNDAAVGTLINDDGDEGWGEPLLFDDRSSVPNVAMNAAGDAMAVWYTSANFGPQRARRYDAGLGWQPIENAAAAGGSVYPAGVAIDADDNALAVWNRYNMIQSRYSAGAGWGTEAPLEALGSTEASQLAGSESGAAVAVWTQKTGSAPRDVYAARYVPGAGWLEPEAMESLSGHANGPDVAIDPAGNALVAWSQPESALALGSATLRRYDAASDTWSEPFLLDSENWTVGLIDLDMNASGDAVATWNQRQGSFERCWVSLYDAETDTWTAARVVSLDEEQQGVRLPQAALSDDGTAFVTWVQENDSTWSAWAAVYDAELGAWGEATLLEHDDTGSAWEPRVAADPAGNAIVVWEQSDGTVKNVRASRYTASDAAWSPPVFVDDDAAESAEDQRIAMDAAGNAIVVWKQGTAVWARRFAAP
jgi:hypothetical protein